MSRKLPHERWLVFEKAVTSYEGVRLLVLSLGTGDWHLSDQLLRASSSVALNIAEGAAELSAGDKARFFRFAIRSACEAAAAVQLLNRASVVDRATAQGLRSELEEIVAILIALCRRLKNPP